MKPKRLALVTLYKHIVVVILLLSGWGLAAPAQAQFDPTIRVECTVDGPNTSAPLRQAIEEAHGPLFKNTITIDPDCLFELDSLAIGYPEGNTNLPAISRNLTIFGNGATLRRPPDSPAQYRILLIGEGVTVTIKDMTFENGYEAINGFGGAIRLNRNANLILENVSFENNRARFHGGAIYAALGEVTVRGGRFEQNAAGISGGAINASGTSDIQEVTFTENQAGQQGGALKLAGDLTLQGNLFRRNTAGSDAEPGNGGALYYLASASPKKLIELRGNTFFKNEAAGNGGGLFFQHTDSDPNRAGLIFNMFNNLWVKNRAGKDGSHLYWRVTRKSPTSFDIFHNTFAGDPATTAGLYLYLDSPVPVAASVQAANNIVVDHSVGLENAGPRQLISRSNLFQNNNTDLKGRFNDARNRRLEPGIPQFVNAANFDYHLRPGAVAIDYEDYFPYLNGTVKVDIEGARRPIGQLYDLGAYEFDPAPAEPGPTPSPDPDPEPNPDPTPSSGGDVTVYLPLVVK